MIFLVFLGFTTLHYVVLAGLIDTETRSSVNRIVIFYEWYCMLMLRTISLYEADRTPVCSVFSHQSDSESMSWCNQS